MMQWIILLSVIILFFFGYFIMDRLDNFLASSHCFPEAKNIVSKIQESHDTLVFGKPDTSIDIYKILEKEKIRFDKAENINELNQSHPYKYLFAVDKADLENIMICSLCERLKSGVNKIAILNNPENKNVYEKYHIPFLYVNGITAIQIVSVLFPHNKKEEG